MSIFTTYYWTDKYYDIKRGLWALWKFLPIVWKMRDWDFAHILMMMKFQLELLSKRMEFRGMEVLESRMEKVNDIKRVIDLLDNKLEDNYADRCGYDWDYDWSFEDIPGNEEFSTLKTTSTKEQEENNNRAIKESHELEQKEWNEMWDTIKENMQGWWD